MKVGVKNDEYTSYQRRMVAMQLRVPTKSR